MADIRQEFALGPAACLRLVLRCDQFHGPLGDFVFQALLVSQQDVVTVRVSY